MRAYRVAWQLVVGTVGLAALVATAVVMRLDVFLAILFTMILFGGVMGYAFKEDLPHVRHPVVGGALLFTAPALYPGLSQLLGAAAGGAVAVLALTSPFIVFRAGGLLRRRLSPTTVEEAAMMGPDEALRRQWMASTHQLRRAETIQDRLLIVRAREQILDDLAERTVGQFPDYVWNTLGGSGDHNSSTGRPHQPH
jgi:hypothetical protein